MTTMAKVKKIDADTHFNLTVDFNELKEFLPRSKVHEAEDMMWRDAERWADPQGVRAALTGAPGDGGGPGARRAESPDPSRDAEVRLKEMDRLGFDMQV